jgi:hypothetical protein
MRITKLKLEDLSVDSFATGQVPTLGGTVRGHLQQVISEPSLPEGTCNNDTGCCPPPTYLPTCMWTCVDDTCDASCPTGPNDPRCWPGTA